MAGIKSRYRTHTCGELSLEHAESEVRLSGWVSRKRDHGGLLFVDLRDHYGVTQIVVSEADLIAAWNSVKPESVVSVGGRVVARGKDLVNKSLSTGEIEVYCSIMEVLSEAGQLPFQVAEPDKAPESTRLAYRFLELRREKLHANVMLRTKVIRAIRETMSDLGFFEFQTPILTSSSPEGARDFLVPSRFHPGKFFALPQAPQQFKQLIMVAGFDRYFQIAPCFRDEDPRRDRSPGEFYQLDLEMSFVEQEDVFEACEQIFYRTFTQFTDFEVTKPPFPRIPYRKAMQDFGIDKPDLRNPLRLVDVTEVFASTEFRVFKDVVSMEDGVIEAIKVSGVSAPSRKYFDELTEWFKQKTGCGVAYLIFEPGALRGSISKFVKGEEAAALRQHLSLKDGDMVFFVAGKRESTLKAAGQLRIKLGEDHDLLEKNCFRFCWVNDFPMFELDEETGQVQFSHNPFSMPQGGMEALESKDPLDILAWQYDIVCNGHELSSGAIRNHKPEIMYKAFEIAGYTKDDVEQKFGGMLHAFQHGAPPHGGMAPGIDRIVMLLAGEETIREVIMFPMAQTVEDLMMGAPSAVSDKQLKDVHIQLALPKKE